MARMIVAGESVEISAKEYDRFKSRAEKAGHGLQILESGVIYRPELIQAIIPDQGGVPVGMPAAVVDMPVADLFDPAKATVRVLDTEYQKLKEIALAAGHELPKGEVDEPPRITAEEIKAIVESQKLTVSEFAASVAYSQASIRMAMKGDRISKELSDAIKAKYGAEG